MVILSIVWEWMHIYIDLRGDFFYKFNVNVYLSAVVKTNESVGT